ncbi:MAG TPA: hybrid sensor histidine kinase/response regulator [Longimicrobiales bacterium]|nr:hybrid sensor histidine kinase/response regulator [Longimicrobiales bacterium]
MRAATLKVLVVDDEPGMRSGAVRALQGFVVDLPEVEGEVDFALSAAGTGEEALEQIHAEAPDILLLDFRLPGISGLEVLEEVAAEYPDVLTIMITAYATLETAVTATKKGSYDFLAKPFTPAELKNVIRKAAARIVLARRARELAEERQRVRFEFISVLAHELKAPLGAVEGYLLNIRDRVLGEDLGRYEKSVDRSLVRIEGMRKLIYDLLDLTRIESGQKKRAFSVVSVRDVAAMAVEAVAADAAARGITITLHPGETVEMEADRGELEIILNNLVSNAVKFNRDGGRVDVRLGWDGERVTVEVADTGIGMSAEERARLFQDFTRIKNEKTRGIMGSGLGLSIVRKLAGLYGGTVAVASEPDVGSTFTVVLSRHTAPQAEGQAAADEA